jgi:hypothetical protein
MGRKYIIAGKEEGFEYSNAKIVGPTNEVEKAVESLRSEGYRIFIVAIHVARIDDFIEGVND